MQIKRLVFASLAICLSLGMAPARAETGSANASEIALKPVKLTEYIPLKVRNNGPEKAEGVVYFVDGLDSNNRRRDDYTATYPYVWGFNRLHGWDVIAAKFPNNERYSFRSIPGSSLYLAQRLKQLREQGYKRVVLAGQSWGAWISVDMAKRDGNASLADALLLTAPANYGTREYGGEPNIYFERNKSEFLESIKTIRTPTIAVFFHDDEFDPGGRGPAARDTFLENGVAAMVVDNPPGLEGHGAGWLPIFDVDYGACLDQFMRKPATMTCTPASAAKVDSRTAITERQAMDNGGRLVSLNDLIGKKFIVTSPRGLVTVEEYDATTANTLSDQSAYKLPIATRGDQICFANGCSRIYSLPDGGMIGFGGDGNWTARLVAVD